MSSTQVVQFVHLLVSVIWIGGMIYTALVLMPSMTSIDPPQRGRLLASVAKRFTIVAWSSVLILLATGLLKTPSRMLVDASSGYGRILLIKHIAFVFMILIGAIITFVVAPKIYKHSPHAGEQPSPVFLQAQARVKVLSSMNMILGILVLLLVSLLS